MRVISIIALSVCLAGCSISDMERKLLSSLSSKPKEIKAPVKKKTSWYSPDRNTKTDFSFDYQVNTFGGDKTGSRWAAEAIVMDMDKEEIQGQINHECKSLAYTLAAFYLVYQRLQKGSINENEANYEMSEIVNRATSNMSHSTRIFYGMQTYHSLSEIAAKAVFTGKDYDSTWKTFDKKCSTEIGYVKYENFLNNPRDYGSIN